MRRLTLAGEEEEGEVQQRCGEKSPSEATEDPSVGGLSPEPTDSKTLPGTALAGAGRSPLSVGTEALGSASAQSGATAPGGAGKGLSFGEGGATALCHLTWESCAYVAFPWIPVGSAIWTVPSYTALLVFFWL